VKYYAHTAAGENGEPLPESFWQPVAAHLSNVAKLAGQFAAPLNLTNEARLAGLLLGSAGDSPTGIVRSPTL
jgi:hypothetical protein